MVSVCLPAPKHTLDHEPSRDELFATILPSTGRYDVKQETMVDYMSRL